MISKLNARNLYYWSEDARVLILCCISISSCIFDVASEGFLYLDQTEFVEQWFVENRNWLFGAAHNSLSTNKALE
jgi:hypothetical protein